MMFAPLLAQFTTKAASIAQALTRAALATENQHLTAAGWTVMILCVGMVCGLSAFCFYRVLRETRPSEHHHAPLEIDTQDAD